MHNLKSKVEIRKLVLARRNALGVAQRIEMSLLAAESGAERISFAAGTIVSAFFAIKSEIDPRPLMDAMRARGAVLCLPAVINKTSIVFRRLVRGAELVDTGYGTYGPASNADVLDPQIMLMPLSAFDHRGARLGYGAGHYDREIARLTKINARPRLIGMAFDCQQYNLLPQDPHDFAMDAIVTESGYREFELE